jgi:hypothetical protein
MEDRIDALEGRISALVHLLSLMPEVTLERIAQARALAVAPHIRGAPFSSHPEKETAALMLLRTLEQRVRIRG